jgi:DNA-binding MarR family transcriptional regulator
MPTRLDMDQVRFIINAGKMIHDRIYKIELSDLGTADLSELSLAQLRVLRVVWEKGEVFMTELSELLKVSPPSVTAMVDRLVDKGFVQRTHSRQDRRKVVVRLSPQTVKPMDRVEENLVRTFTQLVLKLGPDTTQKWCEVLEKVMAVLDHVG